jgi:O-6-methylguanine DNA methyltransferase
MATAPPGQPLLAGYIDTPHGTFTASYSSRGLARLQFPPPKGAMPRSGTPSGALPGKARRWHQRACATLRILLQGQSTSKFPPLDLTAATPFQEQVWSALRRIKPGRTRTYSELGRLIGRPNAARAVGAACGANPLPLFIPCHRVVAQGNQLGGFSAGLHWKRWLLDQEQAARRKGSIPQMKQGASNTPKRPPILTGTSG